MKDMDKGINSLGVLIAQNELAFYILEIKKRTVLFPVSNADNITPRVMFNSGNRLTL